MYPDELIKTFYEIKGLGKDDFLKLKETLTRVGITAKTDNEKRTLFQTAHVLQKRGRYFIVHFKQLFLLDGKDAKTNFTDIDKMRLSKIVTLLEEWGLINVIKIPDDFDDEKYDGVVVMEIPLTVIAFSNKHKWILESKYDIGAKHGRG